MAVTNKHTHTHTHTHGAVCSCRMQTVEMQRGRDITSCGENIQALTAEGAEVN